MKRITISCITVCACLLITAGGCKDQTNTPKPAPQQAGEHPKKVEIGQSPHYHGLIEEYRSQLAEDQNNLASLIGLGNAYSDIGDWKRAITMYEHALRIDPRNTDVRTDMGTAYRNLNQPDRAMAEYRAAIQQDPGCLNARYHLGIMLAHHKKDYRAAIAVWNELLKLSPNFPHADRIRSDIAACTRALAKGRQ